MESLKYPFLCFEASQSEYSQLALDYWSGRVVTGRWKWDSSVEELSEVHGVLKKDVPKLVKSAASAVDLARRCVDCDFPQELSSRSAISTKTYGDHICNMCLQKRNQSRVQKQQEKERQRFEAQRAIIAEVSQRGKTFRYGNACYTDAVIAYSIMLASDEACEQGTFRQSESLHLCAGTLLSNKLLDKLFRSGLLQIDGGTQAQAIEIDEDGWTYVPHLVNWRFAPDTESRSFPEVMSLLGKMIDAREIDPAYGYSVTELWRLLAYDDALHHLSHEAGDYRISDIHVGPKFEQAIWHALERFSIPQVRRAITYVVKEAAALSQHRDFGKRHALNTIPGKLISYVDRAVSDGWQVYPMLHNWQNEESVLLTVLFNRALGTGSLGFKNSSNTTLTSTLLKADR